MGRRIFDYLSAKAQAQVRAQLAEETGTLCREEPLPTRPAKKAKRIRQDTKPVMNRLEEEFFERIKGKYPNYPPVRPQAKRYKLANGTWLRPDFSASLWPREKLSPRGDDMASCETCWEVKGPHAWEDSLIKLKFAAHEWPEVQWLLVWKDQHGQWCKQEVLP